MKSYVIFSIPASHVETLGLELYVNMVICADAIFLFMNSPY